MPCHMCVVCPLEVLLRGILDFLPKMSRNRPGLATGATNVGCGLRYKAPEEMVLGCPNALEKGAAGRGGFLGIRAEGGHKRRWCCALQQGKCLRTVRGMFVEISVCRQLTIFTSDRRASSRMRYGLGCPNALKMGTISRACFSIIHAEEGGVSSMTAGAASKLVVTITRDCCRLVHGQEKQHQCLDFVYYCRNASGRVVRRAHKGGISLLQRTPWTTTRPNPFSTDLDENVAAVKCHS